MGLVHSHGSSSLNEYELQRSRAPRLQKKSCLTQLSMTFFPAINVIKFIRRKNSMIDLSEPYKAEILDIYEYLKVHVHLIYCYYYSYYCNIIITARPVSVA